MGYLPYIFLPMRMHDLLLPKIEAFLASRDVAETTFGRLVVNDGKFVGRLRSGENFTAATYDKVLDFIEREQSAVPDRRDAA